MEVYKKQMSIINEIKSDPGTSLNRGPFTLSHSSLHSSSYILKSAYLLLHETTYKI